MSGIREQTPAERIRVAFILDSIQDWDLGGTERQLVTLVAQLDAGVFEPVIFILQPSEAATAKEVGCPVVMVRRRAKESRLGLLLNLRARLKEFRPHIIQTFFIDGIFYGVTAAWLSGVPVIVESRRNAGHWEKSYHTVVLRFLNRFVDYWQSNSQFVASKLRNEEKIPAERISVLRNHVDFGKFKVANAEQRGEARRRLSLRADTPVFVAVSTLRAVKGLRTVVQAANYVRARLPEAVFLIVGEGPQRAELEEQIRSLGVEAVVRLEGAQADVLPWLQAADIAVLASESESSSNALMEYMAVGLATVVSDIPANRELVSGEFFGVGQAEQLAERLEWLWTNEAARKELGVKNQEAAQLFGGAGYAESVRKYYWELALPHMSAVKRQAAARRWWSKKREAL